MKKSIRRLLFIVGDIILLIFVLLGIYTVTEYRPEAIENVESVSSSQGSVPQNILIQKYKEKIPISIASWNIGYAGLSDDQDFFMDGGKEVYPENISIVQKNLEGVLKTIQKNPSDFWFFQEVDEDSRRSYNINQRNFFSSQTNMNSAFAYNFKCFFIPYPIPPLGTINSGVETYSLFELINNQRISLPVSFKWPVSTANMKRCLLVSRSSLGEEDKELVLINIHLEAYDDGTGRETQTKVLMDIIENEYAKGNYVIAGGDFNQSFSSKALITYPQKEEYWTPPELDFESLPSSDWNFAFDDSTPTTRSLHGSYDEAQKDTWLYYVIDGFIVSPNVSVQSVTTLDEGFVYSDHNPVAIEVILEH